MRYLRFKSYIVLIICIVLTSCYRRFSAPVYYKGNIFTETKHFDTKNKANFQKNSTEAKKRKIFSCPVLGDVIMHKSKTLCPDGILVHGSVGNINFNIISSMNGKVIYFGNSLKLYGNVVIVEHKQDMVIMYAHLGKVNVRVGEKINTGQKIASSSVIFNNKYGVCFIPKKDGEYIKNLANYIDCQ